MRFKSVPRWCPPVGDSFFDAASIANLFVSENGIVAGFGDENQFVKGGIWKITRPLSLERGQVDQIRDNDAYRRVEAFTGASLS